MNVRLYLITTISSFVKAVPGIAGFMLETIYKGETITLYDFFSVECNKETSETIALEKALSRLQKPCDVELYASTSLAASRPNSGIMHRWVANDWKNSKGCEIKDAELWQSLLNVYEKNVISLVMNRTDHHSYTSWMMDYIEKNEELINADKSQNEES